MKAFTLEQHKRVTGGMDNAEVLAFARRLADAQAADVAALRAGARASPTSPRKWKRWRSFAASLGVVERVEILPFHQLGKYKWHRLDITYELEATKPPTAEEVASAAGIFRAAGLQAD